MKKDYDFKKSKRNPYTKLLKKQITIRLDADTITYFKNLSEETGIAYQILINLYLKECVEKEKKPEIFWGQETG